MGYTQKLQIANLQPKLDIIWYNWTWHWTWDWTEPSPWVQWLFWFCRSFSFDGMTDFVKGWRDNDIWCHNLANCPPREVLWYFHTYVGSGHFLGFKILNFTFFGGFQKNEYLLGIKILWILFGGHHNIGLYLGVIFMHFRVFFKVKVQNGEYFF